MRRRFRLITTAACALGLVGTWAGASAGTARAGSQASIPAGRPALWRTYDMIVNLRKLPRAYTCDQLWYEFHGLLLRLGAWPYSLNILPYNCNASPSGVLKSADVEVRFQLPVFLSGSTLKSAPAEAVERTLRLAPGEPKTLQTSDCQLLRQIDQTMLASIAARLDEEHFDCDGPPRQRANFNVTLSLPMAVKMPTVATTSAPGPH